MIATVQVGDVGVGKALSLIRRRPRPGDVKGLRQADVGITATFGPRLRNPPQLGRLGCIAFWDDDAAVDLFFDEHPFAAALAGGWRVRLDPLRLHGSWHGVPDDLPRSRAVDAPGPFAVLTLARLRPSQAVRFFRTSAKAERPVATAPGKIWATVVALPPFMATVSLWESGEALGDYAFRPDGGHNSAILEQRRKDFHRESAFIRFRPYGSEGGLAGRNPLLASWM
jgi:hypothetical protein